MSPSLLQTILALLALHTITTTITTWHKLRHFPGPFLASFSQLWLFLSAISGKAYKIRMAIRQKYGPGLIRIGPDMLLTDDPAIFRRINGVHTGYTRGDWYAVMRLDPYQQTLISSTDTAFHDDVKARTAAGFTGREVPNMEGDIDEEVGNLIRLIDGKYVSDAGGQVKPLDWGLVAQYFTLDSLTKVAYRKAFGYLERDEDVYEYIKTVEEMGVYLAVCSDVPWIGKVLLNRFVLGLFGPSPGDRKGSGAVMGIAQRVVGERFEKGHDGLGNQDMLGSFIRHGLPRRQCEAELPSQLVAGSDTTANILRMGLLLIATTPRFYVKLQGEIDGAINSGKMSSPITSAEARSLGHLQAFLLETLRYNPPISLLFPRVVPPDGETLEGKFIPGGTKIAVDFWSIGRRTDVYGDDVSVFRPERFLEASPEKRDLMEKTTDLMFGYGRYRCPGRNMAWLEMEKVFVELLRRFDFQILDPEVPFTRSHYALFLIRNMHMKVARRSSTR